LRILEMARGLQGSSSQWERWEGGGRGERGRDEGSEGGKGRWGGGRDGGKREGEGDRYGEGGYEEEAPIEWLEGDTSQQGSPSHPGAGPQEEDTFFPRRFMSTVPRHAA